MSSCITHSPKWNWERSDWPDFRYDEDLLDSFAQQYQRLVGESIGVLQHLDGAERDEVRVHLLRDEAMETSAIEGEFLDRASVQSSLRRHFQLQTHDARIPPAERGVAKMMLSVLSGYAEPLTHELLYQWHESLMLGRRDVLQVGGYRADDTPMQIVSGRVDAPRVHFEAPPSSRVPREMDGFLAWFNATHPDGTSPLPAVQRAAIAHLYFVSIHPFEDGNGRIARALAQKVIAQHEGDMIMLALAQVIMRDKKSYYAALDTNTKANEISPWMEYFAQLVVAALQRTKQSIQFVVEKTKIYDRIGDQLNARQHKVLERMFREGVDGFAGGLSARNYRSITGTSKATTTRDLQELVQLGALQRRGERKHTRYYLPMQSGAD